MRILSFFWVKNVIYKGYFTSDVEKNISEIIFFLWDSIKFFGQVFAFIADVEPRKVKIHLFSQAHFLTVEGSTQVVAR